MKSALLYPDSSSTLSADFGESGLPQERVISLSIVGLLHDGELSSAFFASGSG
jgi:hypothetical protein